MSETKEVYTTTTCSGAFVKALIAVQAAGLKAAKDGKNPHLGSRYATLAEVLETIRKPLADNGFAVVQSADVCHHSQTVGVVTRLLHESGESLESARLSAPMRKEYTKSGLELPPGVQAIGAAVTYLRRYSLCAFLSIAVEDDDGEEVQSGTTNTPPTQLRNQARSAYTGKEITTPEGRAAHHQKAEEAKAPATPPPPKAPPKAPAPAMHAALAARLKGAPITAEELRCYLGGELGKPRITNPKLKLGQGLDALPADAVQALIQPSVWNMICERLAAENLPF